MNPLIERQGVCDPHIHIYNGKAYLYATHDDYVPGATGFRMTEWQIWSSEDLVHWQLEDTEKPGEYYCGSIDQCWAVDAAYKDGRYYWYFSVGASEVGVGVSDAPAGPFREALGHALVDGATPPEKVPKWDPCVFLDDDGEAYLVCGSCLWDNEYLIARLNPDMCSLAEPLREIPYIGNPNKEDKASLHKENGVYYLTHASFYATSDNVYGPYTYRGNTGANVDHGCFFTYHGQTYQASGGMDNPSMVYRASFLTYCHYRENGEIVVDQLPVAYGVGQYDAGWERIEAEWFFASHGAEKRELGEGFMMTGMKAGSWLHFPYLNHMEQNALLTLRCSVSSEDGLLEIREGAPDGALLGSCILPGGCAEGEWRTAACRLQNAPGSHSIYLVVKRGQLSLDWFSLQDGSNCSNAEAARGVLLGKAAIAAFTGASNDLAARLAGAGDGVFLLVDGGAGGTAAWTLRYAAREGASALLCQINDEEPMRLELTGGESLQEVSFAARMAAGINRVTLSLQDSAAPVLLDALRIRTASGCFHSYPAGNGRVEPVGNGRWNGLPQRESARSAFSGRCVVNLTAPGHRILWETVDGGEGGDVRLAFRYGNGGEEAVSAQLTINGQPAAVLAFPPTGSERMEQAGTVSVRVRLEPGCSEIALTILEETKPGLCVDALSVIPAKPKEAFHLQTDHDVRPAPLVRPSFSACAPEEEPRRRGFLSCFMTAQPEPREGTRSEKSAGDRAQGPVTG